MAIIYLIFTGRFIKTLKKMAGFVLAPFFRLLYYQTRFEFFNRSARYFTMKDPKDMHPVRMPYGAAIAVGVLVVLAIDIFQLPGPFLGSLTW